MKGKKPETVMLMFKSFARVQRPGGLKPNEIVAFSPKENLASLNYNFSLVSERNDTEDNIMLQCSGPSCYAVVIDLGSLCDKTLPTEKVMYTRGCLDKDQNALVMGLSESG